MRFTPSDHIEAVKPSLSTTTRDSPERVQRWLGPTSGDFRVGGRFDIEGNASGDILTCEKPTLIQVTWEYGGEVSWVDAILAPSADSASLTIKHTAVVPPEWWDQFGAGAVGIGWEMVLMGVAEHLAAPDASPPDPADPALRGPFNKLMTASSIAWADTQVSAGGDPDQARAAGERTLALYTGSDGREA